MVRGFFQRNKSDSKASKSLFLFIGSVIGLLIVAAELWRERRFEHAESLALFAIFSIYVITEKWQAKNSADSEDEILGKINDLRNDIIGSVSKIIDVRLIGSHAEGFDYAARKLSIAKHVQDTYFRTTEDTTVSAHSDKVEKYKEALETMLVNGGSLDVICSKQNLALWKKNITPNSRATVRELDHFSIPLINMIILTYDGGSKEVLFGWNFRDHDDGVVFSSSQPAATAYFNSLYEDLRHLSKPVKL